ncbi:MAG: hypothetical protein COU11_01535 [Candidatus Harrisonbacteria bacterium CG10_big_fil_rev_8_21_14_0_10_49_15]|uniref:HTH arsR-type domain-containing protein n=1 Tax=Candidatus Harrisonbacteria bacterium CG10_big_fil_rev_8_21_14_0_10_49_15 TaxID=1974587 RepID=A0A2H0ULD0_9BACT|nr:MAG: hypothetical protein COU11_01535 [Candidatus Harrisonbacteria bacterium CG10_big_fil_rev_8_21_14_0_10_49_15]
MKNSKQIERHFKGIANHWRIEVMLLLAQEDSLSLEKIAKRLGANFQTMAEHVRRLHVAGLVDKKYHGREVHHSLSPYGKKFVSFLHVVQKL